MSKDFERPVLAAEPATPDASVQARPQISSQTRNIDKKDPVVATLWILITGTIIAILAFVVGALVLGYFGSSHGAQTRSQADLYRNESDWSMEKDSPQAWAAYADSLINAKQYAKAQDIINQAAEKFAKTDTYDYYAQRSQAFLYFAKKDYQGAIDEAVKAQALMSTAYQKELKKNELPNKAKAYGISDNYGEMTLLQAGCYEALKKDDQVISLLEGYVKAHPREAGVWYDLGRAYARKNDNAKALKAFDTALKYMPGDAEIIAAKAKLGDK